MHTAAPVGIAEQLGAFDHVCALQQDRQGACCEWGHVAGLTGVGVCVAGNNCVHIAMQSKSYDMVLAS